MDITSTVHKRSVVAFHIHLVSHQEVLSEVFRKDLNIQRDLPDRCISTGTCDGVGCAVTGITFSRDRERVHDIHFISRLRLCEGRCCEQR
ncbi:MAG: hypothetical protein BWY82_01455 [Verrucomicrobia bacterium ADurb.Bin474]|nr:MAG: hypothetical protein BWY82_01455 [Verrucomicrobia bacterium ADurb.Bin474]